MATTNLQHSPILGWLFDGYPIYGPYGYPVTNDPGRPLSRPAASNAITTAFTESGVVTNPQSFYRVTRTTLVLSSL